MLWFPGVLEGITVKHSLKLLITNYQIIALQLIPCKTHNVLIL